MTQMDAHSKKKAMFKQRVRDWAAKLDVKIVWLGVRPMRNKWASCSTAGHLNFNDDLLRFDAEVWDYVIVHELLHFHVPNHGKLWKSLMSAHLGDYQRVEALLATSPEQSGSSMAVADRQAKHWRAGLQGLHRNS